MFTLAPVVSEGVRDIRNGEVGVGACTVTGISTSIADIINWQLYPRRGETIRCLILDIWRIAPTLISICNFRTLSSS